MSDGASRRGHLSKAGGEIFAENGSETVENDPPGLPPWAAAFTAQIQTTLAAQLAQAHRAELQLAEGCLPTEGDDILETNGSETVENDPAGFTFMGSGRNSENANSLRGTTGRSGQGSSGGNTKTGRGVPRDNISRRTVPKPWRRTKRGYFHGRRGQN